MILARHITHAIPLLIPFLIGVLSLCSCENDMKDIDDIENIQKEEAVDISIDVKIIYSDSAVVKAELTGPELRIYHDSTGNYEFQKGLQIIFFDNDGKETQRIKSDYGVQRSIEGRSEEHTSELQSRENLVCRLLLEKKKQTQAKLLTS